MIPGRFVRGHREAAGITPTELSITAGMREGYLLEIESDQAQRVNTRTYQKLADCLGITLDELASDPEKTPNSWAAEVEPQFRGLARAVIILVLALGALTLSLIVSALVFLASQVPLVSSLAQLFSPAK